MHEFSIARNMLETVLEALVPHAGARPIRVHVKVGELTAVVPEALAFGWEAASVGTPAEGMTLSIESMAARGVCRDCGLASSGLENLLSACRGCGAVSPEIRSGTELTIESLEVDDGQEDTAE
jgi:hydrogenase nickel incorporation protein HypA/HybF